MTSNILIAFWNFFLAAELQQFFKIIIFFFLTIWRSISYSLPELLLFTSPRLMVTIETQAFEQEYQYWKIYANFLNWFPDQGRLQFRNVN